MLLYNGFFKCFLYNSFFECFLLILSEVNPMIDLGVYTYTEVFKATKESQVDYQTKKTKNSIHFIY